MTYYSYFNDTNVQVRAGFSLHETATCMVILTGDGPGHWTVVPSHAWDRITGIPMPVGEDAWVVSEINSEVWRLVKDADISETRAGKAAVLDVMKKIRLDLE